MTNEELINIIQNKTDNSAPWQQVEALPEAERDIITDHHRYRKSLDNIADAVGSTRERIRQTEQKGLRALRRNSEVKEIGQRYGYGTAVRRINGACAGSRIHGQGSTEDSAEEAGGAEPMFHQLVS